jgi:hypothetical protein
LEYNKHIWEWLERSYITISELSRELLTNENALFAIVLQYLHNLDSKNLHSVENKSRKNINIKIFLQNVKCSSTTANDLVISAKFLGVNVIFNIILMFEVRRRVDSSLNMFTIFKIKYLEFPWFNFPNFWKPSRTKYKL